MALAFVDDSTAEVVRNKRLTVTAVTFDNSYPTGGEAITPANVKLSDVDAILATTNGNFSVIYDKATGKLKAYTAAGAEVANATDLSAVVVTLVAIGS